jgi:hypothetical protein
MNSNTRADALMRSCGVLDTPDEEQALTNAAAKKGMTLNSYGAQYGPFIVYLF